MKLNIIVSFLLLIQYTVSAQNADSITFVKNFNKFISDFPLEMTQLFKFDSLNKKLDTSESMRLRKTIELIHIINIVDKYGIEGLRKDTSGLLAYSQKDQKYYIYMDNKVNFDNIEELTGLKIIEYQRFYNKLIEKNGLETYTYSFFPKDTSGIQIPKPIKYKDFAEPRKFYNKDDEYISKASNYWINILDLLKIYHCEPDNLIILNWYKGQEKPSETWRMIASKRRNFIEYIKQNCVLK